MRILSIGTRPSQLALKQLEEIEDLFPGIVFNAFLIKTKGDKDKSTPLPLEEGTDFFTHEIEQALLKDEIDVAVHSAKDLEEEASEGLVVAAMTRSIDPYDALVSRGNLTLDELPSRSRIGTSSINRQEATKKYRKDLVIKDIRGNVDDRIKQLDEEDFDAIIVARAALIRLGLEERIAQVLPFSVIRPNSLQGRLALQVRKDRRDLIKLFEEINEKQ
ncbi:MAG: hydroxymethylbilane synthase [Candidatus Omnitrophica bacterium]|nr:hydroxymethylbilane synthase [Candidatus Omnitrophota bacterium]